MPPPLRSCPTLTTARLTLEPHEAADFDDCLVLWSDPDVVRYLGGVAATPEDVWGRLLRYAGLWSLVGHGYWRMRETATGRFVGETGLADFRRDIHPSLAGAPEAGWALSPWAQGLGLAREATEAVLAWADDALPAARTVCMIDPRNAPSLALAEKLGFRRFADSLYKGRSAVLLERVARPPSIRS